MGFFKSVGSLAGELVGSVIGGTVVLVGEALNSDTIKEIGEGAYKVTANTGKSIGRFADGAAKCVGGAICKDGKAVSEGAKEMGNVAAETVTGVGKGLIYTAELGVEGVGAVLTGDEKKMVEVGKKAVKIAAISALSFSVLDAVDGAMDGSVLDFDHDGVPDFLEHNVAHHGGGHGPLDFDYGENAPQYWVNAPHTAAGGYMRTMPDGNVFNNLSHK